VKGISRELVVEIEDNHVSSQISVQGGGNEVWATFLSHNSGGKSYMGTTEKEGGKEQ